VYSMDLNGQTITLEIAAVSGNDFTYKFKADGVDYDSNGAGDYSDATGNPVSGGAVTGQTTTSVANAFKNVINGSDISGGDVNGDVVATVNSDGTLSIGKSVNFEGPSGTHTTHDDSDALTTNTITDNGTGTVVFEMTGASGKFPEDIDIVINNVAISSTVEAAGTYAQSAAGSIASLQAAIDAKTDAGELAGITFTVAQGASADAIKITAVHSTTGLVANVGVNPGTTTAALQINSQANASGAIATIDAAIVTVNEQRASLGAISNRLDSTVNNLTSISSNLQAGRGRIEDADFAAETTSLAKSQILQQASTAMLAQANASKQNVLSLLQG